MKKLLLALICSSSIFTSCDNDLEIYADNEESMVVFGIINPKDTVHYIKVQKSFQEEGNEDQAALDSSKIYYANDEVSVYVDRYNAGQVEKVDSFEFTPIWLSNRDSGAFVHPTHKVYRYISPNLGVDFRSESFAPFSTYKLRVVQHSGEKDVLSETAIGLSNPISLVKPQLAGSVKTKPIHLYNAKTELEWRQDGGDIETFNFRFHYVEENIISGDRDTLYVDYYLFEGTPVGSNKTVVLNSAVFLNRLSVKIEENPDVIRFPLNVKKNDEGAVVGYPIEIDIWSAQRDLSNYLTINNSTSIGLVESNINHSTIQNGLGLFSSRVNFNLNSDKGLGSVFFDKRSLDSLSCSIHTRLLNFVKYSKNPISTLIEYETGFGRCN